MQYYAEDQREKTTASNDDGDSQNGSEHAHAGGFRITDFSLVEGADLSFVGPVAKGILHNWGIAPKQPQPTLQNNLTMAPRMPGMGGGPTMPQSPNMMSGPKAPAPSQLSVAGGTDVAITDDE